MSSDKTETVARAKIGPIGYRAWQKGGGRKSLAHGLMDLY